MACSLRVQRGGTMGGRSGRVARLLGLAALSFAAGAGPVQSAQYSQRAAIAQSSPEQRVLEARIRELGRGFDGEGGIAGREVESGWATSWNGERYFPQQSVSKFWVALTAFTKADAGQLDLGREV